MDLYVILTKLETSSQSRKYDVLKLGLGLDAVTCLNPDMRPASPARLSTRGSKKDKGELLVTTRRREIGEEEWDAS